MESALQTLTLFAVAFVGALGLGYFWSRWRTGGPRGRWIPELGDVMRVRVDSAMIRTRLSGIEPGAWVFESPISRGAFVPIQVGSELQFEAPTLRGAALFRGTVISRNPETHEFSIGIPQQVHLVDRRQGARRELRPGQVALVESKPIDTLDVSDRGVRFRTWQTFAKGERVHLALDDQQVGAWIIAATPAGLGETASTEYRAVFETPLILK